MNQYIQGMMKMSLRGKVGGDGVTAGQVRVTGSEITGASCDNGKRQAASKLITELSRTVLGRNVSTKWQTHVT